MRLAISGKPDVAVQKCGEPMTIQGHVWQMYTAIDDDETRTWEHDETMDDWLVMDDEIGGQP